MIELTIRCTPHGEEADAFSALRVVVVNTADHPKRPEVGNYRVKVYDADDAHVWTGRVKGHVRAHGLVSLVAKSLARVPSKVRTWPTDWTPKSLKGLEGEL